MEMAFEAIAEDRPGPKMAGAVRPPLARLQPLVPARGRARTADLSWPACAPSASTCRSCCPLYEAISEAAGGGDLEARFLAMWCPPLYVGGCSQLILDGKRAGADPQLRLQPEAAGRQLARLAPQRHGASLAMVDCLWGVLDGINEDGLALSLSFGGRTVVGKGFGIPIVMRYALEFATSVAGGGEDLRARSRAHVLHDLGDRPRRPARDHLRQSGPPRRGDRATGQHQSPAPGGMAAPCCGDAFGRARGCAGSVSRRKTDEALAAFFQPPLFQTSYEKGYGTLYTALYRPARRLRASWSGGIDRWRQSCADFRDGAKTIQLGVRGMRIAVLGGGVVGVAAAYYLSQDGHEVTLIDRNALPASETSYGNAGLVSPGDSYAWASPGALKMFVQIAVPQRPRHQGAAEPRSPFPGLDLAVPAAMHARPRPHQHAAQAAHRDVLQALHQCTRAAYRHRTTIAGHRGILYFYRSQESLDAGAQHMQILADHGLKIEVVGRERLVEIDPGLARGQGQDRRRDLFADGPDRRFLPVRAQPDRLVRAARRRQVPLRRHHPRPGHRGQPRRVGQHRSGAGRGGRLRPGHGRGNRIAGPQDRDQAADLSGEGLFHDGADPQRRARPWAASTRTS